MKHSEVIDSLENDDEIQAYLRSQNVNAVERLNYNDHGPEHVRIVRDNALKLVDILEDEVGFGVEDHGPGFGVEDAKVVVAVASELHDIGHVVHRDDHVKYSVGLADRLVDRVLEGFYGTRARVALKGDVLHAILCHHVDENPLTAEAGIVRLADALDMEEGRSRLPYKKGERSIDTVSSQAIEKVTIKDGTEEYDVPVLVEIEMRNSAGVYQIDSLLKSKLKGSGLEGHVRIVAINEGEDDIVGRIEL